MLNFKYCRIPPIIVGASEVVGQTALQKRVTRNATVTASTDLCVLILYKNDYDSVVYDFIKQKSISFLQSCEYFKTWKIEHLYSLNYDLENRPTTQGEIVYDLGQEARTFFIVLNGKFHVETELEISNQIRYPISSQQWETKIIRKRVQYRVQELGPKDMFGHEEMLDGVPRKCRVVSVTQGELYFVSKSINSYNLVFILIYV